MTPKEKVEITANIRLVSDQDLAQYFEKVLDELLSDPHDFDLKYLRDKIQAEIVNRWLYEQR